MIQFQIGQTFPVILACFDNGCVALLKVHNFKPVLDSFEHGVSGAFHGDYFTLFTKEGDDLQEFEYSTAYNYKTIPLLLAWLKQQNLQPPMFQGGL